MMALRSGPAAASRGRQLRRAQSALRERAVLDDHHHHQGQAGARGAVREGRELARRRRLRAQAHRAVVPALRADRARGIATAARRHGAQGSAVGAGLAQEFLAGAAGHRPDHAEDLPQGRRGRHRGRRRHRGGHRPLGRRPAAGEDHVQQAVHVRAARQHHRPRADGGLRRQPDARDRSRSSSSSGASGHVDTRSYRPVRPRRAGDRPPRLGQLRRRQSDHRHRADRDLEVREPARQHHGAGERQDVDSDPRADLPDEQSRRHSPRSSRSATPCRLWAIAPRRSRTKCAPNASRSTARPTRCD